MDYELRIIVLIWTIPDLDAVDGASKPSYDAGEILVEYVRHELPIEVAFWCGVGPTAASVP